MLTGYLASSKAGHDKGKIFIITEEEHEYVWLADGKTKTQSHPKKKKKKHIQIIKVYQDEEIRKRLLQKETIKDEEIRKVIKTYKKESIIQEEY